MGNVSSSPFDSGYFIFTFVISIVSGLVLIGGLVINGLRLHYRHNSWEMHFDIVEPKRKPLGSKLTLELSSQYAVRIKLLCRDTTVLSEHNTSLVIGVKERLYTRLSKAIQMRRANRTLFVPPSWASLDGTLFPQPAYVPKCPMEIKRVVRITLDDEEEIPFESTVGSYGCKLRFRPVHTLNIHHHLFIYVDVVTGSKWSGAIEFSADVSRTEESVERHRVSRAIKVDGGNS